MTEQPLVCIDIGNTNTHIGIVNGERLTCLDTRIFPTASIRLNFADSLNDLCKESIKNDFRIIVSTVNRHAADELFSECARIGLPSPTKLVWRNNLPLSLRYDDKESFGADRLANLLFSNAAYPNKDTIIISAGTAITIDFLKNGTEFVGGTILPGPRMQCKSLHAETSALPEVSSIESPQSFPGTSTESSIRCGVYFGVAGAIGNIVEKFRVLSGAPCKILATGGAWKSIKSCIELDHCHIPDMTLRGIACFARYCA